jgi:hypothetical protein
VTRARTAIVAVPVALAAVLGAAFYWLGHRGAVPDRNAPIPTCQGTRLAPEVEALVRPVLMARTGEDWGPDYAALEQVIASRQPGALEARVALMAYYLGEHPGEELLESILAEEARATPLVQKYRQCRPALSSEWRMPTVVVLRTLYDIYGEHARKAG